MNNQVKLAAFSLVAFALGAGLGYRLNKPPADPLVARINGEEINETQLRNELQRFAPTVLKDLVEQKVILQEAAKEKIEIPSSELNKRLEEQKKQPMTQSLLKAGQLTEDDLRRNLTTVMHLDAITEKRIKEDDEKEYLLHHREELETLQLQKLTFPDEDSAKKALAALQAPGADFDKLSPEAALVHRSDLEPAWAELLFHLRSGETSPVLHNEQGFLIYKAGQHHFEYKELKGVVHDQVIAEKRKETLEELRHAAKIEVMPPLTLPADIEETTPAPPPRGVKPGKLPSNVPVETD